MDADVRRHFPPWVSDQRDAQIEALRFAFLELARALHEHGALDMNAVSGNLGNGQWLYAGKSPDTAAAVAWLADSLAATRGELGPPPHRR